MPEKCKPLDHSPPLIYGADYWSIVAQDTFEFFWKFPSSPGHIIILW